MALHRAASTSLLHHTNSIFSCSKRTIIRIPMHEHHIRFDQYVGRKRPSRDVLDRFKRLNNGMWIRLHPGKHKYVGVGICALHEERALVDGIYASVHVHQGRMLDAGYRNLIKDQPVKNGSGISGYLKATPRSVDNSEWMRNGDLSPTRMQAQLDAANLVLQCKLRANPETGVAVMQMADKVECLRTFTQDGSRLYMDLHSIRPAGCVKLVPALKVAQMALRHRANRASRCRIVLFVGSPLDAALQQTELTRVAKKLKKENISADVVVFGETEPMDTLSKFVDELNGREGSGSHLVAVAAGANLAEALVSSPVCRGEDGAAPPVALAAGGGGFGFDPNEDDPELAMALRVSLEEQRRRQETETGGGQAPDAEAQQPAQPVQEAPMETGADAPAAAAQGGNFDAMTEDEQLAWALRMSMQEAQQQQNAAGGSSSAPMETQSETSSSKTAPISASDATQEEQGPGSKVGKEPEIAGSSAGEADVAMMDAADLQQLVADLPGVDANAAVVAEAAKQTAQSSQKKASDSADKNKK